MVTDDETTDDGGGGDDSGDDAPAWARRLGEQIAGVRDFITGAGSGGDGASGDGGGDDVDDSDAMVDDVTDDAPPARSSARQTEFDAERHVRDALAKVRREEQTDERVSTLEQKVAQVAERPPVKQSRLSRAMWGDANQARS